MNGDSNTAEDPPLQSSLQSGRPHLLGTTGDLFAGSSDQTKARQADSLTPADDETAGRARPTTKTCPQDSSNFFKSLEWSADGTSLLTCSADHVLRSFILPPTLFDPPHPHSLSPYVSHTLPEPAYATVIHPAYNLADPPTCLLLAALRNLPMRLYSTLGGGVLASYPWVNPTTEAYIAPHSLLFASLRPNEFFAGSDGTIAVFDISRPGEGPVQTMWTGRHRRARVVAPAIVGNAGDGLRGIVSAMGISREGIMAAGTFGRSVGLYDDHGHGEVNAVFSLGDDTDEATKGMGITQVIWGPEGHYLCVVERGSDGVGVWDIRGTGKRLAWLKGRKALTQQRTGVEVMNGEVWAGGTDGVVRVWEGLGMTEGTVEPAWSFEAHGDVVSGTGLHPRGGVLATCSGQRHYPAVEGWGVGIKEDSGSEHSTSHVSLSSKSSLDAESGTCRTDLFDNSLKVWAL